MRKIHWEILISIFVVVVGTGLLYRSLADVENFWNAQSLWSAALLVGYALVAFEYFRHGWLLHHSRTAANLSPVLTLSIFLMQSMLFIKGVYFEDWSLIIGALIVNSGLIFSFYQMVKTYQRSSR